MSEQLRALVSSELGAPVDRQVAELAKAIADEHGVASRAILFYGSCLRERRLEGLILDFYLIVSNYRKAYDHRWLAVANRLVPPNIFYFEKDGLAAKYAVLSEAHFDRECGPNAQSISVVARFAQPARLVWCADSSAREFIEGTVSRCAPTLLSWAAPLAPREAQVLDVWKRAFQLTFAAELRAERTDRTSLIVEADPERYRLFGEAAMGLADPPARDMGRWWKRMQRKGKLLSVVRLAKAGATFAGGADYIAWKINRHAGTSIELKPWQRRWPLLAGLTLLPRLLKSGAIR
jgi:hypothetical protein